MPNFGENDDDEFTTLNLEEPPIEKQIYEKAMELHKLFLLLDRRPTKEESDLFAQASLFCGRSEYNPFNTQ